MSNAWGIHGGVVGVDMLRNPVLVLDRPGIGDLRAIGNDRVGLKDALTRAYPAERPGTIAAWAGVLIRFAFEAKDGDTLAHPDKKTRTVSFGVLDATYYFDDHLDRHCRRVRWTRKRVKRDDLTDELQRRLSARQAFFALPDPDGEMDAFVA